ncbi:MAG: sigma-70 family RNA polymerase sigma factor [Planctomycetota bacterium]
MRNLITYKDIDQLLDAAASDPDTFVERVDELIAELDAQGRDLELTDSWSWRLSGGRRAPSKQASALQQFRQDVEDIITLDRDEEARLARRIEFARRRLMSAREEAGLTGEPGERPSADEPLPRAVARRALELHHLRTEMVERNLYLVLINVERYVQNGVNRPDLIQEGCLSLFRAVDGFDWRRGLLFRTYAVHWLNQAFRNYLYNFNHTVRVPVYLQKALKHINQATIRLGDPNASPEEIAAQSDLNEGLVASAMAAARASYSIDAGLSEGEDASRLRDLLVMDEEESEPYSSRLEDITLEEGVERALSRLSERERKVVRMRFGLGMPSAHTLAEVAKSLGVSVERVRQIQVRALSKMNTPGLRRELDPFLN